MLGAPRRLVSPTVITKDTPLDKPLDFLFRFRVGSLLGECLGAQKNVYLYKIIRSRDGVRSSRSSALVACVRVDYSTIYYVPRTRYEVVVSSTKIKRA